MANLTNVCKPTPQRHFWTTYRIGLGRMILWQVMALKSHEQSALVAAAVGYLLDCPGGALAATRCG